MTPESYSDRLERAAAEGYSARDCRDFAGKGIRLLINAREGASGPQDSPDQQAGPSAQSLALPEGEWPDMFELRLSFGMFVMSPALFKKRAQTAFMLLGAEASKRGYLFDMYEDKETLDRCFRFTRPAQSSGDSGGEEA